MRKRMWFPWNRYSYNEHLKILKTTNMKESDKTALQYWIFAYYHQADVTDRYKAAIWIIIILDLLSWILK